MKVCDAIAQWLKDHEITHAFGIIGGGNVAIWDAISRLGYTQLISCHHEQAAAMAAAYFNRTVERLGAIVLVTTGAGSSNAVTGVMAAYMDGVPLLVISGNEASKYLGAPTRVWGTQGYDSAHVASHIAKWANWASRGKMPMLPQLDLALAHAMSAPRGPAWVDIPKDIQTCAAQ